MENIKNNLKVQINQTKESNNFTLGFFIPNVIINADGTKNCSQMYKNWQNLSNTIMQDNFKNDINYGYNFNQNNNNLFCIDIDLKKDDEYLNKIAFIKNTIIIPNKIVWEISCSKKGMHLYFLIDDWNNFNQKLNFNLRNKNETSGNGIDLFAKTGMVLINKNTNFKDLQTYDIKTVLEIINKLFNFLEINIKNNTTFYYKTVNPKTGEIIRGIEYKNENKKWFKDIKETKSWKEAIENNTCFINDFLNGDNNVSTFENIKKYGLFFLFKKFHQEELWIATFKKYNWTKYLKCWNIYKSFEKPYFKKWLEELNKPVIQFKKKLALIKPRKDKISNQYVYHSINQINKFNIWVSKKKFIINLQQNNKVKAFFTNTRKNGKNIKKIFCFYLNFFNNQQYQINTRISAPDFLNTWIHLAKFFAVKLNKNDIYNISVFSKYIKIVIEDLKLEKLIKRQKHNIRLINFSVYKGFLNDLRTFLKVINDYIYNNKIIVPKSIYALTI